LNIDDLEILHDQIVAWQERRFTVVTGVLTLVTVLCGFVLSDAKRSWTREQARILVCLILFCATLFTWYAGWQNAIIGAFVRSIRDPANQVLGWETGVKMLTSRGDLSAYVSLNKIIAITFAVTAIGATAVFWLHCPSDEKKAAKYIHRTAATFLAIALIVLAYPRVIHPNYDEVWERIRTEHSHSQTTITRP
jgi:cytochrome bd-type quinol oxidase subunit 2